ncbi:tyrosine-type recombinase/integrase [bacterium]|nr:tyrosine-type recombinase/integrase [bacterium]
MLFNQHINEDKENLTAEQLAENRREKVVIHTLRYTFASQLVIHGTPIFTVKERMNHKDIKQTMRYAKLAPKNLKKLLTLPLLNKDLTIQRK